MSISHIQIKYEIYTLYLLESKRQLIYDENNIFTITIRLNIF